MATSLRCAVVVFACLSSVSWGANGWRIFRLGRMVGGNLGKPHVHRQVQSPHVSTEWFTQTLDHFTPTDETVWQQRYYVNDEFFDAKKGGPVFLCIGGEGEATEAWMTQGSWVDYGKKFGALLFQLEHRFYGESHPTEDLSVKNLKHLTSQQALADLATFIVAMNEKYHLPEDVKWIAFGGSYPGSLAAWLRAKYPHLVHGAMSASGPLLAQLDFQAYFQVVSDSLAAYSDQCLSAVRDGFRQIDILMRKEIGQHNLNQMFRLCDPVEESLQNPKDISNLYETIADDFAGVVQYNRDNRIGHPKGSNITIDTVCAILVDQEIGTPVQRLAAVNALILETYDEKCLDYKYETMMDTLGNTSWEGESAEGGRQWMYQTCTEFGFYQTSSQQPHVFGAEFPVGFFVEQCRELFGAEIDARFLQSAVDRTNTIYGALDVEVSNVVFVHGSVDPWHALGITKTRDQKAPAIYIEGTAHCANMYPRSDSDPPQLNAARQQIQDLIDSWLRL